MKHQTRLYWKAPVLCLAMTAASFAATAKMDPVSGEHYRYDASGNMTEKTVNGQTTQMTYFGNRLVSKSSGTQKEAYTYDTAGRPSNLGDTARKAIYGYADRVLSTDSAGKRTEFFYNAEGNLVGKATGGVTTSYTWDGMALAAQNADTFTNEAHMTGGVPVITNGSTVVVSDHLGTTLSVGEKQAPSTAFGEGKDVARFTGKAFVKELESFVFPARLYSAVTSRWTSSDPSGYPEGANNTEYVSSNPVSRVDPTGLLGVPVRFGQSQRAMTANGVEIARWNVFDCNVPCDNGTTIVGYEFISWVLQPAVVVPLAPWEPKFNCYAHALGTHAVWINDFTGGITGDRWRKCTERSCLIAEYPGHAAEVTAVNGAGTITDTSTKNGLSPGPVAAGRNINPYGNPTTFYEK